jgi:hypothetical protein
VKKVVRFLEACGAEGIELYNTEAYDISFHLEGKPYTLEVKEDLLWDKTDKVAIEYHSRGNASGIHSSKAELWCYVLGEDLYFTTLERLKRAIEENVYLRRIGEITIPHSSS